MRYLFPLIAIALVTLPGCSEDSPHTPPPAVQGELVQITAGSFQMGAPTEELGYQGDEAQHPVTLTRDFWMFNTEVTNRQYADLATWALEQGYCTINGTRLYDHLDGSELELMDMDDDEDCDISVVDGHLVIDSGLEDHPVKELYWFGAASFCDWLSLKEGLARAYDHSDPTHWKCNQDLPYQAEGYRLPTEAEWEYACRAGSTTAFASGDILQLSCGEEPALSALGWYCGNASGWTSPVASKDPNSWGLHDMHGNVWEWCNDWYKNTFEEVEVDPIGPPPGWYKVLRGGGWSDVARRCRSASRRNPSPHLADNGRHGFRYVRTILDK